MSYTIKKINEPECDYNLRKLLESKQFSENWHQQVIRDCYVQPVLDTSSKANTGNSGAPDFIYKNPNQNLLILIENKADTKHHKSTSGDRPQQYAVDGVKHYLSFFTKDALLQFGQSIQDYFSCWNIVGIAASGDVDSEYDHEISTYAIVRDNIEEIEIKEILNETDYLGHFENIDYDQISISISSSSTEINNLLRNLDSQKRPVLLSALMTCLYPDNSITDFKRQYSTWALKNVIRNIPTTVKDILENQEIPDNKIEVFINELAFINTDHDLNNTDVVIQILKILQDRVIPLFSMRSSFDIIGRFYEEFLRYAGVTNVKNGIVLTPNHIRELFTEIIDIKPNDVFLDPACGTGGLLISPMNKLEKQIKSSAIRNKLSTIQEIKENRLIGFEKNSTMYSLSISNMLFRGDGKSNIHNVDFFDEAADSILNKLDSKPTIGFINPPYGGQDNKKKPTKKEIQFLERMLDRVSRYGVIIAPLSCFIQNKEIRNRIISKHTLKYVINMPIELFQPNAASATAIAVFETHKPHDNQEVIFYDLSDDGLIMHKTMGRSDRQNRWPQIKRDLLDAISANLNVSSNTRKNLLSKKIGENEEWLYQAHCETDYCSLSKDHFEDTVKEYSIFIAKHRRDLLEDSLSELNLLDLFRSEQITDNKIMDSNVSLNQKQFMDFELIRTKTEPNGLFCLNGAANRKTKETIFPGKFLYVTTSNKNNGVSGTSRICANEGGGYHCRQCY